MDNQYDKLKENNLKRLTIEIKYLDELINKYNKEGVSLDKACELLEGFNLKENDYFDFDYGVATHSIKINKRNKMELVKNGIELWDDATESYIGTINQEDIK